jgi:hypothetical protein
MESAAVIVDESEVTDTRLLQSIACATPHTPSAPPINTALARKIVRAVRLNFVFVLIQMSPPGVCPWVCEDPSYFDRRRAQLRQADILVSFIGQGQLL